GFTLGGDPKSFPILPADAMKQIMQQNNLNWNNISHIELMEAYAVQAILCAKLSGAPTEKINPFGGAISRGHPIGASGAILAVRLFHALKNTQKTGLATIAGAGGLASVLLLKGV
ncbi:MAG: acetyl-CoA C-acetyltransferase, partial [Flavobacteriaceae bacterium]